MKATGLRRVMGFVACAALISSALIAAPRASADEADLKSAFDDYAAGRYEDALKKLQTYVASNPGDDEVYRVLRQVDERVKLKALAAGGEHERHLRYLLDKARPAIEQRRRDPETIKELVDQVLSPELDVRRRASLELATKSGDYAVPYLLPHLASQDVEKVVNAIFALHAIGGEAVLPLTEALQTTDARLRGYTAVVLGDIRDPRALPMLRRVMETDEDADVKAKASAAVQKIRPIGAAASASESFVRIGQRYYANDPSVISEPDQVHNLWRWESDALARYEVPAALFGYQLAQMQAVYALRLQPANIAARSLLVRAVVAQGLEGVLLGDKAPESLKAAETLARSQGFAAVSAALGDALTTSDWDVAAACCALVAKTYGGQPLAGHPLGRALGAPQKAVQYAAAIAALHMSPTTPFENSQQVPALAAQAASETALRLVFVIDDLDQCRGRVCQDLREHGYVVADEKDGWRGVARLKGSPAVDVVIVRADLGAEGVIASDRWRSTLAVIDELTTDFRTKNMR
ncbi:MAG TPA: HEAT repeat domain-containing protein, partial [Planctomycetota bacterium]|nr:HEAT repeat domain-containing protein [Planctomycetota bacterium]